jgi:hypothetical protein
MLKTCANGFLSLCKLAKRDLLNWVNLYQDVLVSHHCIEMVSTVEDLWQVCLREISQKLHLFLVAHGVGAVVKIPVTFLKVLKFQRIIRSN